MIDFPIDDLLDDEACLCWLEKHLHPEGLCCPRCGAQERRVARHTGQIPSYRCKSCDRYHTLLSGTAFEKTRQSPAKLVLMLRGFAKGESTARLARELALSRKQMHTLRHRVQENVYENLPTEVLKEETVFEADELYQNAGEKRSGAYRSCRPAAASCQQGTRAWHLCHGSPADLLSGGAR